MCTAPPRATRLLLLAEAYSRWASGGLVLHLWHARLVRARGFRRTTCLQRGFYVWRAASMWLTPSHGAAAKKGAAPTEARARNNGRRARPEAPSTVLAQLQGASGAPRRNPKAALW